MIDFPVEEQLVYKCPRCGLEQMLLKETARIRELEAENAELHKELDGFALMQRIAKAKEILYYAPFNDNNGSESALIAIGRAKKALEGE